MFPENFSDFGPKVDHLFWVILWITGVFFFLVQGGLLLFILKYRPRPGRKASYVHGHTALEIIWTAVPTLILVGLTLVSQKVWADIRSPRPPTPETVQVKILAEQFAWNIRYAGPDGLFDTADDVATLNQLHLPVGKPVEIALTSKDVIHSFWVPQFRMKQDAVPGLTIQVRLEAIKPGAFELLCAELCGLGHYRMRGFVTTEPEEQFQAWLKEMKEAE